MTMLVRLHRILCLPLLLLLAAIPIAASADDSLGLIESSGVLRVGVDAPYGRMEYYDDGAKLAGVDIDVANQVASALGV